MSEAQNPTSSNSPTMYNAADWKDKFLCSCLLKNARVACSPKILLLTIAAILACTAGWRILGYMFSGSESTNLVKKDGDGWVEFDNNTLVALYGGWAWNEPPRNRAIYPITHKSIKFSKENSSWFTTPFKRFFASRAMLQLVEFEKLFTLRLKFIESMYVLLCFLWGLLVWSVAGGAISRIIALRLTRDDSITLFDSIAHGKRSWLSHLIAPLIPVLAILVIAGFMALFALIGRIPGGFGPFVYSLFLPLWLLGGLILTVLFLGVFMSWPLMWPAVGTECCDAFDALGRAYGYLFSRPLKYLLYFIISIILGFISYFLIGTFVELSVDYTASVSSWGTSDAVIEALNHEEGKAWITVDDKTEEQEIAPTGSKIYKFWLGLLMIIPVAYGYSYFWAAAGNIYLLLRFEEDGTEMDEVYVEDEQYSYSLPPTEAPSSAPGANGNQAENPAGDEKPAE